MCSPYDPKTLSSVLQDLLATPSTRTRRIGPRMSLHFLFDDDAERLGYTGAEMIRAGVAELHMETADELSAALEAYAALRAQLRPLIDRLGLDARV